MDPGSAKNVELAAILCAVQAEQKKARAGGRRSDLAFLSEVHYPIWAVPWEKNSLLIDGMKLISGNVSIPPPSDPEALVEAVKRSVKDQEQYVNTLRSQTSAFQDLSRKQVTIPGYFSDKEMLLDMTSFLNETKATAVESSSRPEEFLPPRIDSAGAVNIKETILEHRATLLSYIKGLQYAVEVVTQETQAHAERLQKELNEIQEDFGRQISTLTAAVNAKVSELENERSSELSRIAKNSSVRIDDALAEKQDLEKQLVRLEQDKSEFEKRRDLRKSKKDAPGEARWNVRVKQLKKQISVLNAKVKVLQDRIAKTRKDAEKAAKKLNDSYTRLVDEEKMKIARLEKSRDLKIEGKKDELDELQQNSLALTHNINGLIEQIRIASSVIGEMTIPLGTSKLTLIGVPMYVARFETEGEEAYFVFSPAVLQEKKGLALKIGTALGVSGLKSRMTSFLKPRSMSIEKLFVLLKKQLESEKELQRSLDEIAVKNNLIAMPEFEERLRKGLDSLESDGWIKPHEKEAVSDAFRKS